MTKDCLYCGNPIVSKRSTKKYCSDNCKQLAFYKRTQLELAPQPGDGYLSLDSKNNLAVYGSDDSENEESVIVNQPLSDNISFEQWEKNKSGRPIDTTLLPNDTVPAKLVNVKSFTLNPETTYHWVESSFIARITEYLDTSKDMLMFQNPQNHWGSYNLPSVKWVSLRLRCLLENLIRLSNHPAVDCSTLITIKDAFTALICSDNFKRLPSNYPNTEFIKELEQKLTFIVKEHKRRDQICFRLTQKRKVEIIAKRFMMADFVPAAKFYDLDFEK